MDTAQVTKLGEAHNFTLCLSDALNEIDGRAHVMTHSTGARLLYLDNDDNNKGFSITFKTPANDDTGVFHILEHSVLCGSEKYPVKEPFVDLLKSSMQTFLNAMTFPDKTMYPVSSTNNKDLENLASVYLDAVFHPNIYKNRRIFEQEGWHLEVDPEDDSLKFNGVVFNEMKGALSDSESVLFDVLCQALFPDTTYNFESGGTPADIPTLGYEDFLDTHKRHYRPSNSYIVLYGNLDLGAFLGLLDDVLNDAQNEPAQINPLNIQAPVVNMNVRREMATSPDSSCAALGFVACESGDYEKVAALQILLDAIMGSNEAPMKKALLEADIADEIESVAMTSVAQPFVAFSARGLHGDDASDELERAVVQEAGRLSAGALDIGLIEAAINHAEFSLREGNFGIPDGVQYSMSAMSGWLYDDDPTAALNYIRYEDVIAKLRAKLGEGYYENLLKEIFLDSNHKASAQIVPVKELSDNPIEDRLDKIRDSLPEDGLEKIVAEAKALHEAQMTPDSPEALKALPRLTRKDIGPAPADIEYEASDMGCIKVIRHHLETHGIVYAARYFDLRGLTFEELPYAAMCALVLGKLDTQDHTASEIDTLVLSDLGSLSFSCETHCISDDDNGVRPYLVARASCLEGNVGKMADMVIEILTKTRFTDIEKLENILTQFKVAKEQQFVMSGDSIAAARASSHLFPKQSIGEQMGNIDFYRLIKGILADFETSSQEVFDKIRDVANRIFVDDGSILSFAGPNDAIERYCESGVELGIRLDPMEMRLTLPRREEVDEAFAVPADVVYCALAGRREGGPAGSSGDDLMGFWMMASRVLSYDYLWNEVRVVGGAYGVRFVSARNGGSIFSSFRDPHVSETFERFASAGKWLSEYDPHDSEFEGIVVSTAASFDKPLKARALIGRQMSMILSDYDYEEYLAYRRQVLESDLADLESLSNEISLIGERGCRCIVGNKTLIEQSGMGIPVIDLFDL